MSDPALIHVVDDDAAMRAALRDLFEASGWTVDVSPSARDALRRIDAVPPDAVVSDVRMPGLTGLDLLEKLSGSGPPVILLSAHGDIQMAVDALHAGAYTFFEKPFDPRRLVSAVRNAADQQRLRISANRLRERLARVSGLDQRLLGASTAMKDLRASVIDLADVPAPLLITGETGTGKELVARALADLQGDTQLVAINCATLSPDGFDTQMFTTAGTLFLDEVATCPPEVQAQLLRLTEDETGPRILSATNADIDRDVAEGGFRADLFYRLSTTRLHCAPLRERTDDIPLLYQRFLGDYAAAHDTDAPTLGAADLSALLSHPWPGNVRELRATALRHILALRRGPTDVAANLHADPTPDAPTTLRESVARFERQMIARALQANEGRMDDTAAELGIGRRTLNEKLVKLGLNKGAF